MLPASIDLVPLTRLVEHTFRGTAVKHVAPMAGGMSSRRFFRVSLDEGCTSAPRSLVATYTPDALTSDEVVRAQSAPLHEWPFLEIQRTLEQAGVRVPAVLGTNCDAGWVLLEDLGDLTLAETLHLHPDAKTDLYRRAVHDLANAQARLEALADTSVIRSRRFDYPLLQWEIEHFRQYALEARGITLEAAQSDAYGRLSSELAKRVASLPYGFVHRDYQSRNLMWVQSNELPFSTANGELAWIDFQDALMGPRIYDLVALLNDSYQTFTREFVEQRLYEFTLARGLPESAAPHIVREFDIVTVQRKLKDAGRFVFFQEKNGDDSYLRFVEPTIDKIKSSLSRLQDERLFQEWSRLLDALV
jgi:N-acetylmuramate 1-kinase